MSDCAARFWSRASSHAKPGPQGVVLLVLRGCGRGKSIFRNSSSQNRVWEQAIRLWARRRTSSKLTKWTSACLACKAWRAFVTEGLPATVRTELDRIATAAAYCLAGLSPGATLAAIALLCQRIAERTQSPDEHAIPARSSSLPGSPLPVTVPAEVLADAIHTFEEKEVAEAIREIRAGGGRKLDEFLPELEQIAADRDVA
jgi:hypothetical protein